MPKLTKAGKKKVNGKAKGSSFELQIAKEIAKALNLEYGKYIRRTPGSGSLLTRSDLWIDPAYRHLCNLYIECKKRENWSWDQYFNGSEWLPIQWYNDAGDKLLVDPDYSPESTIVCLIFTKNRSKVYAMIHLRDFAMLDAKLTNNPNFKWVSVDGDRYAVFEWKYLLDVFRVKE
jgi:hypothetical protein